MHDVVYRPTQRVYTHVQYYLERVIPVSWTYQLILMGLLTSPVRAQDVVFYLMARPLPNLSPRRLARLADFLHYANTSWVGGVPTLVSAWLVKSPRQALPLVGSLLSNNYIDVLKQSCKELVCSRHDEEAHHTIRVLVNAIGESILANSLPVSSTASPRTLVLIMKHIWVRSHLSQLLPLIISLSESLPELPDHSLTQMILSLDRRLDRFRVLLPIVSTGASGVELAWIKSYAKVCQLRQYARTGSNHSDLPKM